MSHVTPSAIMPSSEMHFFDVSQSHIRRGTDELNINEGINATFPHPSDFPEGYLDVSGVHKTYGPTISDLSDIQAQQTGIFHYNNLQGQFSNALGTVSNSITDFTINNPYIHHEYQIAIPYMSTFTASIAYYPYGY